MGHDASTGSPGNGCLTASLSSKNENPGAVYFEWTGTWEDLGVPSGQAVTIVGSSNENDYNWRCRQYVTALNAYPGPFTFRDTGGNLKGTFSTALSDVGSTSAWATVNGSSIAVPSTLQGSTKGIKLRLELFLRTGNSNSAVVELLFDTLSLKMIYDTTGGASVIPQAMSYYTSRRQ
jgi:hypothetical protein